MVTSSSRISDMANRRGCCCSDPKKASPTPSLISLLGQIDQINQDLDYKTWEEDYRCWETQEFKGELLPKKDYDSKVFGVYKLDFMEALLSA